MSDDVLEEENAYSESEESEEYEYESDDSDLNYTSRDDDAAAAAAAAAAANKTTDVLSKLPPTTMHHSSKQLLRSASGAPALAREVSYQVVESSALVERQRRAVAEITGLLGISTYAGLVLLRHFKWNADRVQENWFSDEVKQKALMDSLNITDEDLVEDAENEAAALPEGTLFECPACYESVPSSNCFGMSCGHRLCNDCWRNTLEVAISTEGPRVLFKRCMGSVDERCYKVVPGAVFKRFISPEKYQLYHEREIDSFVFEVRSVKWCPNQACKKAVRYTKGGAREIQCACGTVFCFACLEDAHRPALCSAVGRWLAKAVDEGETANWMTAHTKSCPRCQTPMEIHTCTDDCQTPCSLKGRPVLGGCNHFTCRCGHEFCWMCMGPWSDHGSATGGYYQCNVFNHAGEDDAKMALLKESEREREKEALKMRRYQFYFQRYMQHKEACDNISAIMDHARDNANDMLRGMNELLRQRNDTLKLEQDFDFMNTAAYQVGECRRVLRWSYVVAFELPETSIQTNLFRDQQGMLEMFTDKLQETLAKEDYTRFYDSGEEEWGKAFRDFKSDICQRTDSIRNFMRNVTKEVEGWADGGGDVMLAAGAAGGADSESRACQKCQLVNPVTAAVCCGCAEPVAPKGGWGTDWNCPACSFHNTHASHMRACEVCETARAPPATGTETETAAAAAASASGALR